MYSGKYVFDYVNNETITLFSTYEILSRVFDEDDL